MSEYGDLIQLENIDVDQQVVKIATEKFIEPYDYYKPTVLSESEQIN